MKNRYLELFTSFFKIGAFTFGGGYAMIPLITHETVENKKWNSEKDIMDVVAIAESTPGPIAATAATFVGYRTAGIPGAVCATLGVVLPSFLIILFISGVLTHFSELRAVRYAFMGVRAGVLALMLKALYSMYKQCPKHKAAYAIAAAAFALSAFTGISALLIILACAIAGYVCAAVTKEAKK